MSLAISAFGTFLKAGDGGTSEVFTTIAEVKSITGPSMSADIKDTTTHSTGIPWHTKLAVLLNAGAVSFDINFVPTNATHSQTSGILKDFKNRTTRNFQLVFPDSGSTTWGFTGTYQKVDFKAPVDDILTAAITIEISGQPTLAG